MHAIQLNNLSNIENALQEAQACLGKRGGRYVYIKGTKFVFRKLVREIDEFMRERSLSGRSPVIATQLRQLEVALEKQVAHAPRLIRIQAAFDRAISALFFKTSRRLNRIEFGPHLLATSKSPYRLLPLKGEQGTVACRVRGKSSLRGFHFSKNKVIESILRSFLRLRRLVAVRGGNAGSRMIGPCDYFGNLEQSHRYFYTISIDQEGIPAFLQHSRPPCEEENEPHHTATDIDQMTTSVRAAWHKGSSRHIGEIRQAYTHNQQEATGESLFPNSGILEIEGAEHIVLKKFDPRTVDLSSFKARLVHNHVPFQITSEKLPSSDDYRVVSYHYEPHYAAHQVRQGGGLFLETHAFAQTMTPLTPEASGFVTLGRWKDSSHIELELIAIEIPFGYTLIIDKECIHGDTNLSGMFMMCMTSNHVTMATADCVFLKSRETKRNVSISIEREEVIEPSAIGTFSPLATYQHDSQEQKREYRQKLREEPAILEWMHRFQ